MKAFTNRVAVVTGAASGIGRAMSRRFLEAGMKVVLAAENPEILPPPQDFMEIYQELIGNPKG